MNLSRDIGFLESKLLCIGLCLKVLAHRPDSKCIKTLENYGYKYRFDPSNMADYGRSLEAVTIRCGALRLALDQKRNELAKKQGNLQGKEITRETFTTILAIISKHMGFRIDPKEVTVSEFVAYRKNYERECELLTRRDEAAKPMPGVKTNLNVKHG